MMQVCLQIMAPGDRPTSSAEHEMKATSGDRSTSSAEHEMKATSGDRPTSSAEHEMKATRHDTNGRMGHFGKNGKPQKKTGELKLHSVNSRKSKEL